MRRLREDALIELADAEREALEKVIRTPRTPHALVLRTQIVALNADVFTPKATNPYPFSHAFDMACWVSAVMIMRQHETGVRVIFPQRKPL